MNNPHPQQKDLTPFDGELGVATSLEHMLVDGLELEALRLHQFEANNCKFRRCKLSGAQLLDCYFVNCRFEDCDMSNARVDGTRWDNTDFSDCKMIGINWSTVSRLLFDVRFTHCNLRYSSFRNMRLERIVFADCVAQECSFVETNLRDAEFRGTDLRGAVFAKSDLRQADFRDAQNYWIDPRENNTRGTLISYEGAVMLAQVFDMRLD